MQVTIPVSEMSTMMQERIVNDFPLSLKAMPQEEWQYALTAPSYLMILPEDSVQTFFENAQVENNKTAHRYTALGDRLAALDSMTQESNPA